MLIQLVEHHSRLDADPPLFGIDLQHPVHVLREIEDDAPADGLPGQARSCAPRNNRHAMSPGDLQRGDGIVAVARDHDAQRLHPVDAGIGGIQGAGVGVKAHFAPNRLLQIVLQFVRETHAPPPSNGCGLYCDRQECLSHLERTVAVVFREPTQNITQLPMVSSGCGRIAHN